FNEYRSDSFTGVDIRAYIHIYDSLFSVVLFASSIRLVENSNFCRISSFFQNREKLRAEKQIERGQIRRRFDKLRADLIQLVTECQKSLKNKLSNTPITPAHATSKAIRSRLKRLSNDSKKRPIIPCT
ncbi:uncharacterized protein DEA37_0003590, partial [Paragonimus westermani]